MSTLVLQTGLSLPGRLLLGGTAGLLATLVMDVAMRRLPEGTTAPYVAAGALSGRSLATASHWLAMGVHYGAGMASGLLFVTVALAVEQLGGLAPLSSFAVAAAVQLPVMIAFFSYFVVPTYGRVPADRVDRVRRDWAFSATVYLIALILLVTAPVFIA